MGKTAFIKGYFDTTDLFTDEMISAVRERGGDVTVFSREDVFGEPDTFIVFNNIGYSLGIDADYIDILMDHPFHFHPILQKLPENTHLYCIDRNHVSYIKRFYPNIKNVYFLAHAGCAAAIKALPDADRDIDVLYAGSLSRTKIEKLIPDFDLFTEIDGAVFSEEVLGRLIRQPSVTTEDMIEMVLAEIFPNVSKEDYLTYINAFRFLDGYAVSFFRELSVRILVENGIKVYVLGEGWETCDWSDNENLVLLGKVTAPEVLPYMKRSKIVLNTLTWFKDGAHDRIFNGMMAGAVVLTDTSGYLKEEFADGEDISFFELNEIMDLHERVQDLLDDDTNRKKIAEAGRKKAFEKHTWGHRLETIFEGLK